MIIIFIAFTTLELSDNIPREPYLNFLMLQLKILICIYKLYICSDTLKNKKLWLKYQSSIDTEEFDWINDDTLTP